MLLAVAAIMAGLGIFFGYVAVGMARTQERAIGYEDCEKRLDILRRQLRKKL